MANKSVEPERIYAGGYYITKLADGLYEVPQGLVERFANFNNQHTGFAKTLRDLAAFVAEERGRLVREQNDEWNSITDALGLPRGSNATIDHNKRTLRIIPLDERAAIMKIESPDRANS